jgi:hypothetical protein
LDCNENKKERKLHIRLPLANCRETGWVGMDWIDLAQDRDQCKALVNMVMNLSGSITCWEFLSSCTIASLSRMAQLLGARATLRDKIPNGKNTNTSEKMLHIYYVHVLSSVKILIFKIFWHIVSLLCNCHNSHTYNNSRTITRFSSYAVVSIISGTDTVISTTFVVAQ